MLLTAIAQIVALRVAFVSTIRKTSEPRGHRTRRSQFESAWLHFETIVTSLVSPCF